jgi:hypothetical protein
MKPIGFTHGALHRLHDVYSADNLTLFKNCGCTGIEANCHTPAEIDKLEKIIEYFNGFNRVSLHMPVGLVYRNDDETYNILSRLEKIYRKIGAELAVVHPDLVEDWKVFDGFAMNWAIENMDDRKTNFKNIADLQDFFALHDNWRLVLDVGHCKSNDPTMALADQFKKIFQNRIAEIHLSGYYVYHEPLHKTGQTEIIDACRGLDVPIIIESTFDVEDGVEALKKEFDFILNHL